MRVLIVGSGGREHALAVSFARHMPPADIAVAPGNPGLAREFACLPLRTHQEIADWCLATQPAYVVIGPEQPLAEGLVDLLRFQGIACVGPSQAAARIETSKGYTKDLMARHGILTAEYRTFSDLKDAEDYVTAQDKFPIVIKADGLAAGKGVTIAKDLDTALAALRKELAGEGSAVVIEEFLEGWETSLFAITDGTDYVTTLFCQDHKQLCDGDRGPNTGGMGAVCPLHAAEPYREQIEARIVSPILKALREEGCPFEGFLYCGLMITPEGPQVVEFNCRLGDPETQALLPLLNTDLDAVCRAVIERKVGGLKLDWQDQTSVCVVLASKGYPGTPACGYPITFHPEMHSQLYYSGVGESSGALVNWGGRVVSLVARGENLEAARATVYGDTGKIDFYGKTFRSDIGLRVNTL